MYGKRDPNLTTEKRSGRGEQRLEARHGPDVRSTLREVRCIERLKLSNRTLQDSVKGRSNFWMLMGGLFSDKPSSSTAPGAHGIYDTRPDPPRRAARHVHIQVLVQLANQLGLSAVGRSK